MSARAPVVRGLAWTSLCTDISSKMVRAIEPLFLVDSLGLGRDIVALLEGFANGVDIILRWLSGRWSDRLQRRKPLTLAGYALSTLSRPLLAVAPNALIVAVAKGGDRAGAGLRKAPRNAWLADAAQEDHSPAHRAFLYQKAMDHTGGAAGMLVAGLLLAWAVSPRGVIWWSILPALVGLSVLARLREVAWSTAVAPRPEGGAGHAGIDRTALRGVLILGAFLGLANISEKLFVIRAADVFGTGFTEQQRFLFGAAAAFWVFAASAIIGAYAQRWTHRLSAPATVALGLGMNAVVYAGFMVRAIPWPAAFLLFACKGATEALAYPAARALAAACADQPAGRGRAVGSLEAAEAATTTLATPLAGLLWIHGPGWRSAMLVGLCSTLAAAAALRRLPTEARR